MIGIFKETGPNHEVLLSEAQARSIIEAAILERGWREHPDRHYRIERHRGRDLWCYSGVDVRFVSQMMQIRIDARTGEIVLAANTSR